MPDQPSRPARTDWLIAVAIVAALFTLQSLRRVGNGPWGIDGSYYMQVARHVAAGDGLVTSVDIYDQGLRSLPARTNIYPLWPLVLGFVAKVVPLHAAATFVPRMFFVIDLLLLFALVRRFASPVIAYLAIAMFGVNTNFFSATCYPYTEGLALFCLFAALLLFDKAERTRLPLYFAMCGVAAAAGFLTRSQLLLAGVALGIVLLATRASWLHVASFCCGYAITVLPWVIYLTTFVKPFTPSALIAMSSETSGLPAYDQHVPVHGLAGFALDRLSGIGVMFNPFSRLSFVSSFGIAALLAPIALVYVIVRRTWTGAVVAAATAAAGALVCVVLLEAHNRFFLEWLFGYRHGLPFILLIVVAMAQMSGHYAKPFAIGMAVVSIITSLLPTTAFALTVPDEWPSAAESQFSQWIATHDPTAIVLTTNAQQLTVASDANFRWAACDQSADEITRVIRLVRTDYAIVYEAEQRCPFVQGVAQLATPVATFGSAPNRLMLLKVRR